MTEESSRVSNLYRHKTWRPSLLFNRRLSTASRPVSYLSEGSIFPLVRSATIMPHCSQPHSQHEHWGSSTSGSLSHPCPTPSYPRPSSPARYSQQRSCSPQSPEWPPTRRPRPTPRRYHPHSPVPGLCCIVRYHRRRPHRKWGWRLCVRSCGGRPCILRSWDVCSHRRSQWGCHRSGRGLGCRFQ